MDIKKDVPCWLPMESAPKDGTRIFLAYKESYGLEYCRGMWVENYGAPGWSTIGGFVIPIRWMPIPELKNETEIHHIKPEPPPSRIIRYGWCPSLCKHCGSTVNRQFPKFWIKKCDQPKCKSHSCERQT